MSKQIRHNQLTGRMIRAVGDKIARAGKGDGRLCIINYHRILESSDPLLESEPDTDTFHWQMELLAECFNVMPLDEALQHLVGKHMPARAVCITFDDGYRSVHDFAFPILKKFSLPATVFVTSGYVSGENMWNDRIIEAVQRLPSGRLDLRELDLGVHTIEGLPDRKLTANRLTEISKYLPPRARDEVVHKLEDLAGVNIKPGLMLTEQMVREMAAGKIEIGAHTVTHPILTSLEDEIARHEIEASKKQLEAITGKPVRLFAYPNGKAGMDFDERHVRMAKDAGFSAAFTTAMGAATAKHDRFQLPRSRPWDATPSRFGFRLLRWLAG